jgi:hypothetical protein
LRFPLCAIGPLSFLRDVPAHNRFASRAITLFAGRARDGVIRGPFPSSHRRDTGPVTVSDADRKKMASITRDLALAETDEEPPPDRRREIIAWANERRTRQGMPVLVDEEKDEPPEEEFYRRARALGHGCQVGRSAAESWRIRKCGHA